MSFNNISFILNKPQLSENIGACARAAKNFNFSKLVIIDPKPSFPNDKIFNVTQNKKTIVTNINSANEFQTKDVINAQDTPNQVVNISNQLEYIFEIKTQEPDPIANIRPNI